jgi:hypothetical protein
MTTKVVDLVPPLLAHAQASAAGLLAVSTATHRRGTRIAAGF